MVPKTHDKENLSNLSSRKVSCLSEKLILSHLNEKWLPSDESHYCWQSQTHTKQAKHISDNNYLLSGKK